MSGFMSQTMRALPPGVPAGWCSQCALADALEEPSREADGPALVQNDIPFPGQRSGLIGDYEVFELLGQRGREHIGAPLPARGIFLPAASFGRQRAPASPQVNVAVERCCGQGCPRAGHGGDAENTPRYRRGRFSIFPKAAVMAYLA